MNLILSKRKLFNIKLCLLILLYPLSTFIYFIFKDSIIPINIVHPFLYTTFSLLILKIGSSLKFFRSNLILLWVINGTTSFLIGLFTNVNQNPLEVLFVYFGAIIIPVMITSDFINNKDYINWDNLIQIIFFSQTILIIILFFLELNIKGNLIESNTIGFLKLDYSRVQWPYAIQLLFLPDILKLLNKKYNNSTWFLLLIILCLTINSFLSFSRGVSICTLISIIVLVFYKLITKRIEYEKFRTIMISRFSIIYIISSFTSIIIILNYYLSNLSDYSPLRFYLVRIGIYNNFDGFSSFSFNTSFRNLFESRSFFWDVFFKKIDFFSIIFGNGINNSKEFLDNFINQGSIEKIKLFSSFHSQILTAVFERGLLGFIIIFFLYIAIYKTNNASLKHLKNYSYIFSIFLTFNTIFLFNSMGIELYNASGKYFTSLISTFMILKYHSKLIINSNEK